MVEQEEKDVSQVKVRMLDEDKDVIQVKVPTAKIRAIREVNPDFYKLIPAKDIAIIALNQLLYDEKHRKKKEPQKMSEKYFVFAMKEDGGIEPVIWFETLKEARKEAKDWKRRYPSDKPIYIGKLLFEPKGEA